MKRGVRKKERDILGERKRGEESYVLEMMKMRKTGGEKRGEEREEERGENDRRRKERRKKRRK